MAIENIKNEPYEALFENVLINNLNNLIINREYIKEV